MLYFTDKIVNKLSIIKLEMVIPTDKEKTH